MMRGLILALLSLSATTALAETPWYVGGGLGMTNYENKVDFSGTTLDPDTWDSGFQVFGGYQFDENWAIEGGYTDFGSMDDYDPNAQFIGLGYEFESTGFYLNGQYHIPIANRTSLDLVFGWLFGDADATYKWPDGIGGFDTEKFSYNDNGGMLGLAFTWQAGASIGVRGTANYYMIDYDNTVKEPWRLGVDVIWNF